MDPATPLLALSKAVSSRSKPFLLRRGAGARLPAPAPLLRRFPFAAAASASAPRGLAVPGDLLLLSLARLALRGPGTRAAAAAAPRRWFASLSATSPLPSGGPPRGGSGGAGNGDGGGDGSGGDGWKRPRASQGAGVAEEAAVRGADVIVLDVGVWLFLRAYYSPSALKKHIL
jgi:Cu2+-exporting ATPase